jgi:F0F1-type ATP synthase, subunit a
MTTASGCHIFSGCGYPAPSISDFYFKPIFTVAGIQITKPIVLAVLAAVIILTFFYVAFRKPKLVPRGTQNLGELGVLFVRDQILRQQLGKKGDRYLPFIVALFFFVWIMNVFSLIPLIQFPATSRFAFPVALSLIVWVTYITIGIKSKGPIGYFKQMAVPEGAPWWILPLLAPVELFSNIWSGRSRSRSGSSPTCSPGTCCCWCSGWRPGTCSACRSACSSRRRRSC